LNWFCSYCVLIENRFVLFLCFRWTWLVIFAAWEIQECQIHVSVVLCRNRKKGKILWLNRNLSWLMITIEQSRIIWFSGNQWNIENIFAVQDSCLLHCEFRQWERACKFTNNNKNNNSLIVSTNIIRFELLLFANLISTEKCHRFCDSNRNFSSDLSSHRSVW
jgi:hypothetical protein